MKKMPKEKPTPQMRWKTTRRRFLIGTGTLGVLGVGSYFGLRAAIPSLLESVFAAAESGGGTGPTGPLLWFGLDAKTGLTLYIPKAEMGQGIHSTIAQLAAEELEIEPTQLRIQMMDSSRTGLSELSSTAASSSTTSMYQPVRQAAANMREMLKLEAATQLNVPVAEVITLRGACFARSNPNTKLEYTQLVAAKTGEWTEPSTPATLKPREKFMVIGRNTPRLDVPDKITGRTQYGMQARAPGMLYGAVARPPRFGATLRGGNGDAAKTMPGVKTVLIDPTNNFAGIVADTRTRARNALEKLQLEWNGGSNLSQNELEALVTATAGQGTVVRDRGNATANLGSDALEAAYRTPLAAHAHLEPLAALVHVREDMIEAWVPTQAVSAEAGLLNSAFAGKKVLVHGMQMGGSFGRKLNQTASLEAARLSQAANAPVHVAWTRAEEMQHSIYRQPSHSLLRGNVDANGKISAFEHAIAAGDTSTGPLEDVLGTLFGIGFGLDPSAGLIGLLGPYAIANERIHSRMVPLPIQTGLWRGVGLLPNVFAIESFMDELAAKARLDPLEFRLQHLGDDQRSQRMRGVLEEVKRKSDWKSTPSTGTARGVACSISSNTAVAIVSEVQVQAGQVRVNRVTVAVDCGLVVNPNGAALQAKGSVVMGISSALIEKIVLKDGAVLQSNFDDYPILRLEQTPSRIDVHFVDSGLDPQGMGEPVIGPVAPSVANAVFALTGQRLRELPLKLQA
jgi:isoquinoline 1-oxidoreductase subunit beta